MLRGGAFRFGMAGPLALTAAVTSLLAMSLWFPKGSAGIDQLVVPMIAFPVIWGALIIYAILDERLWRVAALLIGLIALNGLILWQAERPDTATHGHAG